MLRQHVANALVYLGLPAPFKRCSQLSKTLILRGIGLTVLEALNNVPKQGAESVLCGLDSHASCGIMSNDLVQFRQYRERMNKRILSANNLGIKRFFALDSRAYEKGTLDVKTKELLGLVASTVLRCNDCITYHVIRCVQEGVSDAALFEALNVALIVGGSITIPHIRRASDILDQCREKELKGKAVGL